MIPQADQTVVDLFAGDQSRGRRTREVAWFRMEVSGRVIASGCIAFERALRKALIAFVRCEKYAI